MINNMKNFIEVTNAHGKRLVNVNSIGFVQQNASGCSITFNAVDAQGKWTSLVVNESYDAIKDAIHQALLHQD